MLYNRHEFHHFRAWSGLFLRYSEGNINPNEAEYQYCRNNLKPYAHFFIALITNLMVSTSFGTDFYLVYNIQSFQTFLFTVEFRCTPFWHLIGPPTVNSLCSLQASCSFLCMHF